MTIEPQGERTPQSRHEMYRPDMTHDRLDNALVTSVVHGVDAARIVEGSRYNVAVLASATDILRLNIEAEPDVPLLEHQWMQTGVANSRISTEIPKQRPSVLASPGEIAQSLEEGETLAGVIAAAAWFEDERRPHYRGTLKSRRKGVSNEELRLNSIANKSITRGFGFKYRQSRPGPQAAPLLWGRALQLLPGLEYDGVSQLLVPIGQGLEQSLTLNADLSQYFPGSLKNMAVKATRARDVSRTRLPERIKEAIMLSGMSPEDKVAELRREQLDLQRRLLMADLYPQEPPVLQRPIPHPRRPRD